MRFFGAIVFREDAKVRSCGMQIDCIDNIHQFDKVKKTWEAVYSVDPYAHVFVSWAWLRGWFEVTPHRWSVLAIRPDNTSPYVAFFPLYMHTFRKYKIDWLRELHMGGKPSADYTGLVCLPGYEEKAIASLAVYVQQQLKWDRFYMRDVLDPRLDLFLKDFFPEKFNVQQANRISCPYIPLPNNWEQYLQEFLSSKTRRNLRYYSRKIEGLDEFRVTHVQLDNLDSQIEALLTLWQARWGPKFAGYHALLRHCFENHCLWLIVLWHGTTPIAAGAAFVDQQKKTFSFYIMGVNYKFAKLSPGKVILGYSIRYAIENGFQIYDFLRGDEDYKFSFGATERFTTSTLITRKSLRNIIANFIK